VFAGVDVAAEPAQMYLAACVFLLLPNGRGDLRGVADATLQQLCSGAAHAGRDAGAGQPGCPGQTGIARQHARRQRCARAVGIYGNGSFGNHFTLAETEN
jgi:hypothetical protein